MKKRLFATVAVVLAVGASAFTKVNTQQKTTVVYYWYDAATNQELPGNPMAEPSSGCESTGTGCAKGFINPEEDPEHSTPQATRKED